MELKIEEVKKLIAERFRGNQSWFAEDVGVDRGYLNRILNGKINNDSPRICNSLIKYCETNDLDYRHYINFFHLNVQKNEQNATRYTKVRGCRKNGNIQTERHR